jgi:hypothetical protein
MNYFTQSGADLTRELPFPRVVKGTTTLRRNRRKSPVKGPRAKKSDVPTPAVDAKDEAFPNTVKGRLTRPKIWIAASIGGALVLLGGLAFQLLTKDPIFPLFGGPHADSATAAAFVGSETCAGCHQAEAQLWRGSQHQLAMQHAIGAWRF